MTAIIKPAVIKPVIKIKIGKPAKLLCAVCVHTRTYTRNAAVKQSIESAAVTCAQRERVAFSKRGAIVDLVALAMETQFLAPPAKPDRAGRINFAARYIRS